MGVLMKEFDNQNFLHFNYNLSPTKPTITVFDRYDSLEATQYDMHYDLEIGVVISGKVTRRYHESTYELGPGDVWIAGMWEPHGFYLNEVTCEMMCIMVSPECLEALLPPGFGWMNIFSNKKRRCPYIKTEFKEELIKKCLLQVEIEKEGRDTAGIWRCNTLLALLLYILDSNPSLLEKNDDTGYAATSAWSGVEKALDTIVATNGLVSISQAASSVNRSTSHFSREFKRLTGTSFARFTMGYRIKQSAIMLINTNAPIKQIAGDLGFRDSSHYIKCFQNYFSVSPSVYRKQNKDK